METNSNPAEYPKLSFKRATTSGFGSVTPKGGCRRRCGIVSSASAWCWHRRSPVSAAPGVRAAAAAATAEGASGCVTHTPALYDQITGPECEQVTRSDAAMFLPLEPEYGAPRVS